jgi:hypothetical protein
MDIKDILTAEERKVWQDDPGWDLLRPLTHEEIRLKFILDLNRWWTEISQTLLSQLPPVTEPYTPPKENDPYIPLAHR